VGVLRPWHVDCDLVLSSPSLVVPWSTTPLCPWSALRRHDFSRSHLTPFVAGRRNPCSPCALFLSPLSSFSSPHFFFSDVFPAFPPPRLGALRSRLFPPVSCEWTFRLLPGCPCLRPLCAYQFFSSFLYKPSPFSSVCTFVADANCLTPFLSPPPSATPLPPFWSTSSCPTESV